MFTLLLVIIFLALAFDFINGFHDAANSIATVVSTKVLSPLQAVVWAAFFNVLAYWIFDMSVGNTVAKTVHVEIINLWVILAGLIAALIWNLLTWWLGIPSSSSHTLIGGFAGAAVAHAGWDVVASAEITGIVLFIFLAPLIGAFISWFITVVTLIRNFTIKFAVIMVISALTIAFMGLMIQYYHMSPVILYLFIVLLVLFLVAYFWLFFETKDRPSAFKESIVYRRLQLVSSAVFSIGHGGADSQKVMGIICAALIVYGQQTDAPSAFKVSERLYLDNTKKHISILNTDRSPTLVKQVDRTTWVQKSDGDTVFHKGSFSGEWSKYNPYLETKSSKVFSKIESETMPGWIAFGCYLMIGLGTLFGGWKIVKTMGSKITKVTPLEGVCAETAGAITLFTVSQMGIPVSTTHTITGSIIGSGATKRLSAVRWRVTLYLLWAWVLTIPVSALLAMLIYSIIQWLI